MRYIELRGKYAVEPHRYACVDDDMFDELNQHKWKAKPNGGKTNVYAVRVQKCDDGKSRDVRMHRVVLNYAGALDIDHINHDSLDNRRENLRVVTRSENALNGRPVSVSGSCKYCHAPFTRSTVSRSRGRVLLCSTECSARPYGTANHAPKQKPSVCCAKCGTVFEAKRQGNVYCSSRCKQQVKWARMVANNSVTVKRNAERSRAWRQARKFTDPFQHFA